MKIGPGKSAEDYERFTLECLDKHMVERAQVYATLALLRAQIEANRKLNPDDPIYRFR